MTWNFRQGGKTENPKDSGIKDFSKNIFESVIREATQNAIDKRLNENLPVKIIFKFGDISSDKIPAFEELKQRWKDIYNKWKDQDQYENILKAILERIEEFGNEIPYLSISDFNTKGMDFTSNPDIDKTGYGAFSRGNHSYHDSNNAAGSEGQGKAALYAISAMRTMFVHTVSSEGSIYEGLTRLATHVYHGNKYNADGYYPHLPDRPEYEGLTPNHYLPFRRDLSDFGTTITLVGLWSYEDVRGKMIKSAINNFWMAIHDGDLIIQVDDTVLDKNSIENLIEQYLPEREESSRAKSNPTDFGRAKCYYETWTGKSENIEIYEEKIDILGDCVLKIAQHSDYPGKVAFFRIQKMLIVRSSVNTFVSKGYCGVFICNDEEGNKMLRKMEGKTHTEWDPKLCSTKEDKKNADHAIKALNSFIKRSWESYRRKYLPEMLDLKGLKGLSIGNKPNGDKKSTGIKEKKQIVSSPRAKKLQPMFEKHGITKKGLKSARITNSDVWEYSLVLNSNGNKKLEIIMTPATDASRVKNNDLLEVKTASDGWDINNNSIKGDLVDGENIIKFSLNEKERVALDFKLITL